MKKCAFIFPGQGAQKVGMGRDFYDSFSIAKETFQEADEILGSSFSECIFTGPAEELSLTRNCQVALFVTSCAILRVIQQQMPTLTPSAVAGLSLGEYTALTAAGVISFADGVQLVKARGELMHASAVRNPGSMSVVLGMTEALVAEGLQSVQEKHDVWIANLNCPGQVVLSGSKQGLEVAAESLKKNGAKRVLPLDVSGAFHSPYMSEAKERLATRIEETQFEKPKCAVVMNVVGGFVEDATEMKSYLVQQVVSPVYWEKGIHALEESGIEHFLEIGPGKTLAGMNKRIGVKSQTTSIETVNDLNTLGDLHAATR